MKVWIDKHGSEESVMLVLCDIDGVIADVKEQFRAYMPDWGEYYRHLSENKPIKEIVEVVRGLLGEEHDIVFMTGRPSSTRKETEEWLLRSIDYLNSKDSGVRLLMRGRGDNRLTSLIKVEICRRLRPALVIEDEPTAVKLLSREGFTVLQVHGYRVDQRKQDLVPRRI